jgi:hypothetical protein
MRKWIWAAVILFLAVMPVAGHAAGIIIDHTNWNWYSSQGKEVFDRVGQQTVFFSHASVGSNITEGLQRLRASNAGVYQMIVTKEDGTPPSQAQAGRFYEYNRGNPGWMNKMNQFRLYIQNGWRTPKASYSMDKLCYIDQNADAGYYIELMKQLNATYPETRFVLWTMPLTASADSDNVLRNQYNSAVRNFAAGNGSFLFDIADIEAWSPKGVQQTFVSGGVTYQSLYPGYTDDGGHLNPTGAERVATGIYSLLGHATQPPLTVPKLAVPVMVR